MTDYDIIVIGAGHAGMMTATYLARAGLDVVILEKGLEVGGDMSTESFAHPGYWHNLHSYYHLGADRLAPFKDLEFDRFHADYITPDPQNVLLLEDGRTIVGWLDLQKTVESIATVSTKDAQTVQDVNRRLGRFLREELVPALYERPQNGSDPLTNLKGSPEAREVGEFINLTAREAANRLFKDPAIEAFYLNQLPVTRGLRDDVPGLGHVVLLAVAQAESMMLLVDVSASEIFGTRVQKKNQMITEICAVLAFSAIKNNDKVGVIFFSNEVEKYIPPKKGKSHILRLIRELLYFKPKNKGTSINSALDFLLKVAKRKSVVFLISDFIDSKYWKTLKMVNKKHDIIGIRLFDPSEKELPDLGLVKVLDQETNEEFWIDTSKHTNREEYKILIDININELNSKCKKNKFDLISISTKGDYIEPLMSYFQRREKRV